MSDSDITPAAPGFHAGRSTPVAPGWNEILSPSKDAGRSVYQQGPRRPGVCIPWEEKLAELPQITGDAELCRRVWEDVDGLAYTYIWHCLVSF